MSSSTDWSLYWADWLVAFALANGTPSSIYGGWNQNTAPLKHVKPGDRVFLTTGYQGRLHLLGGLAVTHVGRRQDEDPAPHGCANLRVDGTPLAPFRTDRLVPAEWLVDWSFLNASGSRRAVNHLVDGVLTKTASFQGCFRIEPETAERLASLLQPTDHSDLLSDDPTLRALELERAAQAEDEALALVYLDALLERGDARAPVVDLELRGAHRGDREAKKALDAHLADHEAEVLGRPGGFPFRMSWTVPKKLRA